TPRRDGADLRLLPFPCLSAKEEVDVCPKHPRSVLESKPFVEHPRVLVRSIDTENDVSTLSVTQDDGDRAHQRSPNTPTVRFGAGVKAEHIAEVRACGIGIDGADDA